MNGHFNQLTPAEEERLAILAEECAETIQVIGKILRHGYESTHPDGGPTNRLLLEKELGDIEAARSMMHDANDIDPMRICMNAAKKLVRIKTYLHHQ